MPSSWLWRTLQRMERNGPIDVESLCSLLRACGISQSLPDARAIHARIAPGFLASSPLVAGHLFHMYLHCGGLQDAIEVFDHFPARRSIALWTAAIGALIDAGQSSLALEFYHRMLLDGERADPITFLAVLGACSSSRIGDAIHSHILASRFDRCHATKVGNAMISMYGKCGSVDSAAGIFSSTRARDLITWTSMITVFARAGQSLDAISCFRSMLLDGISANAVTIVSVLNSSPGIEDGRIIHRIAAEEGFLTNPLAANAVINMYGKSGCVPEARRVFRECGARCVTSWNTLMSTLVHHELDDQALALFKEMISKGSIYPDNVSCILALTACANLGALSDGEAVHAVARDAGLLVPDRPDPVLANAVLHMYGRCGRLVQAAAIFRQLGGEGFLVSSNAMIAAFSQQGLWREALALFRGMQAAGTRPSKVTFAAVIDSCAGVSALAEGRSIHALAETVALDREALVATALVDMYGRCGCLEISQRIFDEIPGKERGELAWSTLFGAYARRGRIDRAMKILATMQQDGVRIHPALFVSVLNSCSHAGMVEECLRQFASMRLDHSIQPKMEHFGCVIDLLGRLGLLDEAERFMGRIPGGRPNHLIWMSFLGSCRTHNDLARAKRAAAEAIALEPRRSSSYAVLASLIAQEH